jgi:hypothetical protein
MFLLIELSLVVLAAIFALTVPHMGERWLAPLERGFNNVARRRGLSVILVGTLALGGRLALLPVLPVPDPAVHDEFSYLLAADTFAHGRLANPTHPMWVHFETFHVNQRPTYVSMYYPAQGLFLALGQVMFGHPFWGVWLSTGLMCAAICWMLQGWLSPVWALVGGLLAVIRLGTLSYWMNSYWGGSVAALGGALVLGALPRIRRHLRTRDAVLLGVGFALIANTRPYEGLFFLIPVAWYLLSLMQRSSSPRRVILSRGFAPPSLILVLTLAAMAYYFWCTTGSPFRTPFEVNVATYNPVPYFPWQTVKQVPVYTHAVMDKFYLGWWMQQYELGRTHPGVLLILKSCIFWFFFIGPLLTIPIVAICFVLPYGISVRQFSRRTRFFLLLCAVVILGSLLPVYFNPHYVAPITSAVYALILIALQNIRRWKPWGRTSGVAIIRAVVVIAVMMFLLRMAKPSWAATDSSFATWCSPFVANSYRAEITSQLIGTSGNHLVLVRYAPEHAPINEWVYNGADLDNSKVVWARDMGAEKNSELIRYFRCHKVWSINPDEVPPKLSEYDLNNDRNENRASSDSQTCVEGFR